MNFRYSPLAAAILATLAAPVVAAEETEATATLPTVTVTGTAEPDRSYTPVTTETRIPAELRDVPQSVTVINEAVLDDQAATSLTEALRNVPGITLSAGEGGNIGDSINLRGFSARTDIFLDGLRDRGQYTRDVFSLNAVEVLKGPASMLFGRGSTGGVINQISKRPQRNDSTEISASVGTDDYYRTTFDANRKMSDTSAVRLNAFWQDVSYERDVTEKQSFGFAPSMRFGMGTDTEMTISALIQRNDEIPDYGGPLLRSGPGKLAKPLEVDERFYGFSSDHFDQDVEVFTVAFRHKINDRLTLRNQTQYNHVTTDAQPSPLGTVSVVAGACQTQYGTTAFSSIPLNCLQAVRQDRDRDVDDVSLYNLTDLTARFETGSIRHTLITGLEIGQDSYSFERYSWPANQMVNLGNPATVPRPGPAVPGQTTDTDATTFAVYTNDQLDLNEHWKLVAGLRWDRFDAESTNENFTLPPGYTAITAAPASMESTDEMLSTRGGVIYQPTLQQSYYVSYGTSFNPSAEAVTQSSGNVSLEPEENRSYELGGKWSFNDDALLVNAAVFRVEKTNARTGASPNTTLDGKIRVEGFEASMIGQITGEWQVIGGYTFLNSEVLESQDVGTGISAGVNSEGKDYQNTPRHSATLWSTYRVTPNWQVGAGAAGTTERFVNNFETAAIDGYVRADAMVAYLQPNYDVRFNVQNLTDELYYDVASGGRATAAMGRRFILTGTYRF